MNDIHTKLVQYVETFFEHTLLGHSEARTRRDYYNGIQHTAEEVATLRKRKQPVVTDNRIKRKVDYLLGVERQTRTDPKAFPRTPDDDESAQVFTDAIRFVCDNNDWDMERSESFDYLCVEGIEAYMIDEGEMGGESQIMPKHIPHNRFIYDPHSTDRYFRDSKYLGVITWMDIEDAKQMFKGKEEVLNVTPTQTNSSFDDKPNNAIWIDSNRKRVMIILLDFLEAGVWHRGLFTKEGMLFKAESSRFLDEYGQPESNIVAGGAFIDQDNDRYGIVRQMISAQDEINKRRSKYLHLLSQRQTYGNQKAVENVNKAKTEMAKPDGHLELQGNAQLGQDFGVLPTGDMAIGQFNLLQDALGSIEGMGQGDVVGSTASGRSKEISQNSNLIELGPLLDTHRQVSKLVYKQIFNRIKQSWTGRKFIRITDDEKNVKFSELNKPMTNADLVIEKLGQEEGQKVIAQYQGDPRLNQVVEVRNAPAQVNVDIIIEDAPDVANIQAEQFEELVRIAPSYPEEVKFKHILQMSTIRNKDQILEDMNGGDEEQQALQQKVIDQQNQIKQLVTELELKGKEAKINLDKASTREKEARTKQIAIETEAQEIENEIAVESVGMVFK